MALKRTRPRRRASITSLIDVIFLLLLFFMLASSFSKFSEVEISSTTAAAGQTSDNPILILTIGTDTLLLDGKPIPLSHLTYRLEIFENDNRVPIVAVKLVDEVPTQTLIDVLAELKRTPWIEVFVVEPT
jgi:biopolymer transport protein ExbD